MRTAPGPLSVDTGVSVGPRQPLGSMWARRDLLVQRHQDHKERIKTITNISNGEWYVEWPDLSQTPEAPTVANLVEGGIRHWAAVGGAVLPSVRVPVRASQDRTQAKRGARKRERRLRELWDKSNAGEAAALLWGDYAGTGDCTLGVWADFTVPPAERDPYFVRFDPRHTYPLLDNQGRVSELLVARSISKLELAARLPEDQRELFNDADEEEVEEWFWYTPDRFTHVLVDISKDGRNSGRNLVLVNEENKLGFVPAVNISLPSFDGQRRGIFDQTVNILRTMHRLTLLTIASSEEHSFPTMVEFDAVNPEDAGPGGLVSLRSAEGFLQRLSPTAHFDVKDLIARLSEDAHKQAVLPQQLHGEPGASIVSARGIGASMGALDARLALAHKQFELLFGKVSGMLLAFDEVYCDGKKMIYGDRTDTRKGEAFLPSRDIGGAWEAECTYGLGAGTEPTNMEARLALLLSQRLLSRETARDNLYFLEDPDSEPVKMLRELMQDALAAGLVARAEQADLAPVAKLMELLQKDDVDYDAVLEEMVEFLQQPPPQQGGGNNPLAQAESLARGGIPGNAEQGPPAAQMGLPPLAKLMGQDARMVA